MAAALAAAGRAIGIGGVISVDTFPPSYLPRRPCLYDEINFGRQSVEIPCTIILHLKPLVLDATKCETCPLAVPVHSNAPLPPSTVIAFFKGYQRPDFPHGRIPLGHFSVPSPVSRTGLEFLSRTVSRAHVNSNHHLPLCIFPPRHRYSPAHSGEWMMAE